PQSPKEAFAPSNLNLVEVSHGDCNLVPRRVNATQHPLRGTAPPRGVHRPAGGPVRARQWPSCRQGRLRDGGRPAGGTHLTREPPGRSRLGAATTPSTAAPPGHGIRTAGVFLRLRDGGHSGDAALGERGRDRGRSPVYRQG